MRLMPKSPGRARELIPPQLWLAENRTCSLKDLRRDRHRRVDGVADDADPCHGAVFGDALAQALHDACAHSDAAITVLTCIMPVQVTRWWS